jgi:CitB family two-component system sensor histidine kinase MalK
MSKISLTLQTKIIILVWTVVAAALLITNILITQNITSAVEKSMKDNALNIARLAARSPTIVNGLNNRNQQDMIQNLANDMRLATGVEFIVVFDMNGIRRSHPNPQNVGQHIAGGDESQALAGEEYVSVAQGTLGHSLRAFSPIFNQEGQQVGAVVVGILLNDVKDAVEKSKATVYFATAIGLLIGVIGAMLLAKNIKSTLFGLEPAAIARLLEERSAMLQSVREGIIAIDNRGNVTLVNQEALRLLNIAGVHGELIGKSAEETIPNTRLTDILKSGKSELDQEQNINGLRILTNRLPVIVNGQTVGVIATFRDKSEVHQLAEELTGVNSYIEALRSQAHEFMNKLHVILGMVRLEYYDELEAFIRHLAQQHQAEVNYIGALIKDHVIAGFMLSKLSRARELGITMTISEDSFLPRTGSPAIVHELVTIIGNLVDNAFDAVAQQERREVKVKFHYQTQETQLTIIVTDTGPGIPPEVKEKLFTKGFSTKDSTRGFGLALVQHSINELGGCITVETAALSQGACFIVQIPYVSEGEAT